MTPQRIIPEVFLWKLVVSNHGQGWTQYGEKAVGTTLLTKHNW